MMMRTLLVLATLCWQVRLSYQDAIQQSRPLVCSCNLWNVRDSMCRVSSSDLVLDYWECKSGWTTKTDCVAKTVAKRDAGINIAVALDNDVVIPVLLSQSTTINFGLTTGFTDGTSHFNGGVRWKDTANCYDPETNSVNEDVCYNELVLEGRRSQSSEDVPKFTNVTFTLPDKSWGCEYHVSRLQCTRPDLTISDSQGLFEDVSGTSVCNQTKGSILANRFQPDFCYVLKNPLHVGETLDFELHATSVFRGEKGDSVDIQAAPEPGIPVGMQFLEQQVQVPKGSNTRAITWTPRPGQQDKRHVASFLAYIVPADFGGASCSALSRYVHIEVKVPEYESKWVAPTLDKGLQQILTQPWQCEKSGLACNGSSRRDRSAQCTGNENDCVVALKEAVSGAAGPDLVFEVPPGQMIEGLNLQCRSSVKSPLEPLIELINVTRTSAFGSVTEQGHCTSKSCKHGTHLAGWHVFVGIDSIDVVTEQHGGVGVDYQRVQFDFKYASESNTDEGYDKRWCFACRDDAHMYPPAVQCVRVITRLCEAYIQEGDDLHSITRKFHLDRNWRRLWNLNSELTDPHRVVHGDKTLRLGPIYSVREGDSMMTLAARFETTIKRLLSVNPHIVDGRHIMPGLEICVVACSNRPPPSHFINPAYSVLRALSNFSQTR